MIMEKSILIVEDEIRMRSLLTDYFKREGYRIFQADNGVMGLDIFQTSEINLVILDIMMPEMDGFTLCKNIRKTSDVPIIILTARSEEDDKLLGYELGADDYITKPFSPRILVAKAKALLKRSEASAGSSSEGVIDIGGLVINELSHEVHINKESIYLSPKEFDLLLYFIKNKGIALTREKLLDNVWGYTYDGDLRTVDTHIKRLREKLQGKADLISTVRGSGYKFEVKE
jgi:two-component system, OmpR family, response regulator ResD